MGASTTSTTIGTLGTPTTRYMVGVQSDLERQKNWRVVLYDGKGCFIRTLFDVSAVRLAAGLGPQRSGHPLHVGPEGEPLPVQCEPRPGRSRQIVRQREPAAQAERALVEPSGRSDPRCDVRWHVPLVSPSGRRRGADLQTGASRRVWNALEERTLHRLSQLHRDALHEPGSPNASDADLRRLRLPRESAGTASAAGDTTTSRPMAGWHT